jgi:RimJ/RimL family protein N-acetyltransferase
MDVDYQKMGFTSTGLIMKNLETTRMCLRSWKEQDLDAMTAINQDAIVCKYFPEIGTRETTKALIQHILKHDDEHGFSLYAVELKATHEMIGFIGLMTPSFEAHFTPAIEIGWRLASQHWNKGYATEGAIAVINHAFTDLHLKKLVSFTAINNQPSRRVMEKIGMHHDPLDDFDHPKLTADSPLKRHVLYRLTNLDYLQKQSRTT